VSQRGLAGALVALALLLANGAQLFGFSYARHAQTAAGGIDSARSVAAARRGAALEPWVAARHALLAQTEADAGHAESALAGHVRALAWSPADASLWIEYALALGRAGRVDDMALPTRRANALAPHSPPVQRANATAAVAYWRDADEALREEWMRSVRYTLRHESAAFLEGLTVRGQTRALCEGPAQRLPRMRLCERIAQRCDEGRPCPPP
jgi:hypothetical protein